MSGAHVPAAPNTVAASDQDVLLRLALWLADVATEATLVPSAPETRSASWCGTGSWRRSTGLRLPGPSSNDSGRAPKGPRGPAHRPMTPSWRGTSRERDDCPNARAHHLPHEPAA
jgi:hypothetical protein